MPDIAAIIARGYATQEEITALTIDRSPEGLARQGMFWSEDRFEHFHGLALADDRFLILNEILSIRGPRTMVGMVGVFRQEGEQRVMDHERSRAAFMAAGEAAIQYARGFSVPLA